jgi:hypothetical protein
MKSLLRASLLALLVLGAYAGFASTSALGHVPGAPQCPTPSLPSVR